MGLKARRWSCQSSTPICVKGRDEDGSWRWCVCARRPERDMANQRTLCEAWIWIPGIYEHRQPTCEECLAVIAKGGVLPTFPADLREFLREEE